MSEISELKSEIEKIKERNIKVEKDKAWETSWIRKIVIALTTYLVMTLFMWSINVEKPYINAIVPTLGYLLSTASLDIIKSWWLKQKENKSSQIAS